MRSWLQMPPAAYNKKNTFIGSPEKNTFIRSALSALLDAWDTAHPQKGEEGIEVAVGKKERTAVTSQQEADIIETYTPEEREIIETFTPEEREKWLSKNKEERARRLRDLEEERAKKATTNNSQATLATPAEYVEATPAELVEATPVNNSQAKTNSSQATTNNSQKAGRRRQTKIKNNKKGRGRTRR